jgi:hypothetical protein
VNIQQLKAGDHQRSPRQVPTESVQDPASAPDQPQPVAEPAPKEDSSTYESPSSPTDAFVAQAKNEETKRSIAALAEHNDFAIDEAEEEEDIEL